MMSIKKSIVDALKQNLLPGLVLQMFAAAIVLTYFFVPTSQPVFGVLANLKRTYGSFYAFFSTALFGGLIPFLYLFFSKKMDSRRNLVGVLFFYCIFWGYKGVEVDYFYQLQGHWFGYDNSIKTILCKTAADQFIYSTFWAAPTIAIIYLWVESEFNVRKWRESLTKDFFSINIPTMIFSNWLVWIPAVSIVYIMPQDLQIPLFNLVLCFWVLILAVLSKR